MAGDVQSVVEQKPAIEAVLRYLLHRSPFFAETLHAFSQAHPDFPRDKWIEFRSTGHTGWFFFSSDGAGRYTGTRPVGVADADMQVETNKAGGPNFALRELYKSLIARLPEGPERNHYYALLPLLYEMSDGTFELRETRSFLERCTTELENTQGEGGASTFSRFLEKEKVRLGTNLLDYRVPGYYAGEMCLLHYAWHDVAWIPLSAIKLTGRTFSTGRGLIWFVFESILENEGPQRIEASSKQLHDEAHKLVVSAQESTDLNDFFDKLFVSCALFSGSKAGYGYLANSKQLDGPYRKAQQLMENACEEYFVTASTSLSNEMENRVTGGKNFKRHVQQVSELRRSKGELAAALKVTELTDVRLFYPSCLKPILLAGGKGPGTEAKAAS